MLVEEEDEADGGGGLAGDLTVRRAPLMLVNIAGNSEGEGDNDHDSINNKTQQ